LSVEEFTMRWLYTLLFYAATPFVLARLAWRGRLEPAYRQRWLERLGFYPHTPPLKHIWFHAVSVGEAEAAFPLIRAFQQRFPDAPVLVTTTTPTGSARVRTVLGDSVAHVYLPYDLPDVIARFLRQFQPRLAIIMETEIWPNLYRACAVRNIPLAIVNARLSERSAKGYRRLGQFARDTLAGVNLIAAQTAADAERFASIGAKAVKVTGNIKYDVELPPDYVEQARTLRETLFGQRPVWIAASTHEGEEALLLQAFTVLRVTKPDLILLLVPRHPPRFDAVAAQCLAAGWRLARRSRKETAAQADVFLLDSLGELRLFYGAADVAFVGGSLVPVGGHNLLEPALAGVATLFGPQMFNFKQVAQGLLAAGGAWQVQNVEELAVRLGELFANPARRDAMGENGRCFVETGRGALLRVEQALVALLESK
jgi:3-deoxy-D-manno-octulosonic-acid transferase